MSVFDRFDGFHMRVISKFILIFPAHFIFAGNGLGGKAHTPIPIGICFGYIRVWYNFPPAERHSRHHLYTACHNTISHASFYFCCGRGNGFQTGGTIAVNRYARNLIGIQRH
ncbi:hypothetical protein D9M68_675010 [compost metagenome]